MKNASLFLPFAFLLLTSACGPRGGAVAAGAAIGTCPVCHMKVRASDEWTAEIYFKDNLKLMFESPGDMLAFYLTPEAYESDAAHRDLANIDRIAVKDYESKQPIDARQATLVFESRVEGPMGPDFLPFSKREAAEAFVAANGGTLLSLGSVVQQMVRSLRK